MHTNPCTLRLPPSLDRLPEVVAFVEDHAGAAGVPAARIPGLCLAAEEAFVNICSHAFQGGRGEVSLSCSAAAAAFVLEISDTGPEFDPLSVPAPDLALPLEQRRVGGLGVHLVRNLTDRADWRRDNGRNILRLAVNLNREGSRPG